MSSSSTRFAFLEVEDGGKAPLPFSITEYEHRLALLRSRLQELDLNARTLRPLNTACSCGT